MINATNLNILAFHGYPQVKAKETENSDVTENQEITNNDNDQKQVMSFKAAEALKSYNYTTNPADIKTSLSMNDYKNKLTSYGLVEGKNYDVVGESILIQNNKGQLSKVVTWQNGQNKENYLGSADITYPNDSNIEYVSAEYDKDGNFISKNTQYKTITEDNLPDGFSLNTGKDEYIKYLEANNINYTAEAFDGGKVQTISETDANGNVVKDTRFMQSPVDEKGVYIMHTVYDAANENVQKNYTWCPNKNTISVKDYTL